MRVQSATRRPWRLRVAAIALAVASAPLACRDAAEPFRPVDRLPPADASLVQLTFSLADDRAPAWSPEGDSIYFTTSRYEGNPLAPRMILAVPVDGMGSIVPLLRNVNEGTTGRATWTSAPAVSAQERGVAFVRVPPLLPDGPCSGIRRCPMFENLSMVRLTRGELHARSLDAAHALEEDLVLRLAFLGHSQVEDPTVRGGVLTISEYHPFQYQFESAGRSFYRPTWNPQGTELVVSDGLRLLRWRLGASTVDTLPGTADGIMPAWSPDGAWIAYARYPRTGSVTFDCQYLNTEDFAVDCEERRIMHFADQPLIVLVRPDGSEERVLGPGTDPAWSPDGAFVFAADVAASGMIVRIPLAGGPTTVVPRTDRGVEPAVSPDGRRLAFARRGPPGGSGAHDIWVMDLP